MVVVEERVLFLKSPTEVTLGLASNSMLLLLLLRGLGDTTVEKRNRKKRFESFVILILLGNLIGSLSEGGQGHTGPVKEEIQTCYLHDPITPTLSFTTFSISLDSD